MSIAIQASKSTLYCVTYTLGSSLSTIIARHARMSAVLSYALQAIGLSRLEGSRACLPYGPTLYPGLEAHVTVMYPFLFLYMLAPRQVYCSIHFLNFIERTIQTARRVWTHEDLSHVCLSIWTSGCIFSLFHPGNTIKSSLTRCLGTRSMERHILACQ